ncbi:MAG: hypothetical protein KA066_01765 [Candidatus Pacebacteria bacterium]|nr:hypothetical protein [Candidatus Paceibacterota bacterium]
MFGKKSSAQTVLILDIENGSVASALLKLAPGEAPRLFGEARIAVPLMDTRSAHSLARAVEHAASESLLHASEVAARLRHHAGALPPVSKVVIFMAAPWGVPNLAQGRPDFTPAFQELAPRIRSLFGDVPTSLHAHASAAVHGLRAAYPHEERALLLSVNGEVSELLMLEDARVVGHATAPVGLGTVLRTLKSHAGQSEHEARSAMRLGAQTEAGQAAAAHFAGEFKHAARELFGGQASGNVFVLAHEPASEWFARSLSHRSLAELFPQGGTVRAMRPGHLAPFVAHHGTPDTHLLLDALYTSASLAHGRGN